MHYLFRILLRSAVFSIQPHAVWRFRLLPSNFRTDGRRKNKCKLLQVFNPRPCRGDATPVSFLRCPPNYEADRAEILHSLWGIFCATFGKKKLIGSYQVTELWCHKRYNVRPFLREIAEYGTLEGDIEASFDYFGSKLTLWHRHHIL